MADAGQAASGALAGAGTGATIGTAIYPGIGTAVGAVGGAIIGALPGLMTNKAEKFNKDRIKELERLKEADALGLTPSERSAMMERAQVQSQAQMQQFANQRGQYLASGAVSGAGQVEGVSAQQDQIGAQVQSQNALTVEEAHLKRKREMEGELSARVAAQGEKQKERQAAIAKVGQAAYQGFAEGKESANTVSGPNSDYASQLSRDYGISLEQANSVMSNPQTSQDLSVLMGGAH